MKNIIEKLKTNYISFIYCVCTIGICWIGVCRNVGTGAQWACTNNCIGFCAFIMFAIRYDIKDFIKLPYIIWSVLFAVAIYPIYSYIKPGTDYDAQFLTALINIGLCGIVLIRLIFQWKSNGFVKYIKIAPFLTLSLIMLVMCIISRNESIWPIYYLIYFLGISFAPVDKSILKQIINGVVDGIIISFFWVQIRAFLYRPYDTGAAYCGHFNNENVNGMFYVLSMTGIVSKLWFLLTHRKTGNRNEKTIRDLKTIIYFLLAVSILDFALFTGSRTALLAALGITGIGLTCFTVFHQKKFSSLIITGLLIGVTSLALLFPVYACMRYIPALRHHPIWYGDYSENKVHSWDPIDSPKYTTFNQALEASALARFLKYLPDIQLADAECYYSLNLNESGNVLSLNGCLIWFEPIITLDTAVRTREYPGGTWVYEYDDGVEPGTDQTHSAFIVDIGEDGYWVDLSQYNPFGIRWYIWKYFAERLNILGHKDAHRYVYLSDWFGHAHNTFLQVAYYFGIIAGVAFLLMTIYVPIAGWRKIRRDSEEADYYFFPMVFMVAFFLEGMFECLSFIGLPMYSLFFVVACIYVMNERTLGHNVTEINER